MTISWIPVALLIGSVVVIYIACQYFVNGIEWTGKNAGIDEKATGTILAAFGTALPESVVTLTAVAFNGSPAAKNLGVGAALGGPLVLSTIAYATVGIALIMSGQSLPSAPATKNIFRHLRRDQGWFLSIFTLKIVLGLLVFAHKPWFGLLFLAAYVMYVRQEMLGPRGGEEVELAPLKFQPRSTVPSTSAVLFQTLLALGIIFLAARTFVAQLEHLGDVLGVRPELLALLLSPVATELPETMNAVIWVRQGKYRLALSNISGSMMIQATIPTAFGVFFTPWLLTPPLIAAAGVTMIAVVTMFCAFQGGVVARGSLAKMGGFYALFIAVIVGFHLGR